MPDVTLVDIANGVRQTWAACSSAVTNVIPASRVYFGRAAEGSALPYCVFEFKDVSAYFGGTEYFSGARYVRATQITFKIYATRTTDLSAFTTALNDQLGWSSTDDNGIWIIPNASRILSAMPEVEGMELEEERVSGEDVIRYETTFTIKMECDRG